MANCCISSYRIAGEASDIDALYALMLKLKTEKGNGTWVGHIVEALNDGQIPEGLYVRGWWSGIERERDCIYFDLESAWQPLYEAWDFICSKYENLTAYFIGEEPDCDVFLKRENKDRGWFAGHCYVDARTPKGNYLREFFDTIDEAFSYIRRIADANILTSEDVEDLNLKWKKQDEATFIYLHEYESV